MPTLRVPALPTIRDILKLYRLTATKALSQNFILDERLCDKIIRKAGDISNSSILEVGPGPGGLTRSIMKKLPKKIVLVEKDRRFKPMLEMLQDSYASVNGKMEIVYDDILNVNMSDYFSETEKMDWNDKRPDICVIGNLPFNVSTHLIIKWLKAISERQGVWSFGRTKLLLTFQKEVAERLVAQPSEEQRSRLSLMAQAWTFPIHRFTIPGSAFLPKPDVDVGVVTFVPLSTPRTKHDFKLFEKMARHIFSFRQKYSIRCVETLFPLHCREELAKMMYKLCDLDPTLRPTQLTVEDVDKLCTAYRYLAEKHPEIDTYEYHSSRRVLGYKYTSNIRVEEYTET